MTTAFGYPSDPTVDAAARRSSWRVYPYLLVPDDPQLHFPQAEGCQGMASDTYYASGFVQGERTGKHYAFFVIFARLSGFSSMSGIDMHLGALFDLVNGAYTTFASYDLPPKRWFRKRLTITHGHLGVAWHSSRWKSRFWARYDASGAPVPFGYTLDVCGRDSYGDPLMLDLIVDAIKPPQPVGGPVHNGAITVMGQPNPGPTSRVCAIAARSDGAAWKRRCAAILAGLTGSGFLSMSVRTPVFWQIAIATNGRRCRSITAGNSACGGILHATNATVRSRSAG